MPVTDAMVEAAALSDATFDGRDFPALGAADKRRYRDRARAALTAALSQDEWQDMSAAPGDEETPVLLWMDGQYAIGLTWRRRDGTIIGKASMFGNQCATKWKPLPAPPLPTQEEG